MSFSKKIIYGCEENGETESPYLTRYTLAKFFGCAIYLHVFHRSDNNEFHDHPWAFASLILWNGYLEETPKGRKRVWPGMILFRKAKHAHRVELVDSKKAITLVVRGRYYRQWGFFTKEGWMQWEEFFAKRGCETDEV